MCPLKANLKLLVIKSSSGKATDNSQITLSMVFHVFILLSARSVDNNSSISVEDGISLDHKVLRK